MNMVCFRNTEIGASKNRLLDASITLIIFCGFDRPIKGTEMGTSKRFAQSHQVVRTCFSISRSYQYMAWEKSRGGFWKNIYEQLHFSLKDSLIWFFQWLLKARVFKSSSGACAAFLANYDTSAFVRVNFWNHPYDLPPWSISILPDCKTVTFNTARVRRDPKLFIPNLLMVIWLSRITCCVWKWLLKKQNDKT